MIFAPALGLAVADAASAQSSPAAEAPLQHPPYYRWHVAGPGESIQFGVPGSDDRTLRIDCHDGHIEIIFPDAAAR